MGIPELQTINLSMPLYSTEL